MKKLVRITTIPLSLEKLLENQLVFMKEFYDVTAISSDYKRLKQFGLEQGVNTYHIELTRKITPLKDLKAVLNLYRYLKKHKPFIIHTHTPKAGIVGMLSAKLANVPFRLHTVAGLPLLETNGIKRRILDMVEKLTYSCATRIYPNSFGLKEIILKNNFTKESKIKVIANGSSNGINTEYFNPSKFSKKKRNNLKKLLNIKETDFVFIYVGRVVGDKGINELVEAFDKLSKKQDNINLLLVGSFEKELDPLEKQTMRIISSNSQIITVGFQSDVRPYFAIANVLTFPSYREGFPNVVMQAGAMGLPSIVSNINGCNEIIEDNKNGLIIPVKDTGALYKAMIKIMNDKEMTKVTRQMITNRFEQKIVWEALLEEYKSLMIKHV